MSNSVHSLKCMQLWRTIGRMVILAFIKHYLDSRQTIVNIPVDFIEACLSCLGKSLTLRIIHVSTGEGIGCKGIGANPKSSPLVAFRLWQVWHFFPGPIKIVVVVDSIFFTTKLSSVKIYVRDFWTEAWLVPLSQRYLCLFCKI